MRNKKQQRDKGDKGDYDQMFFSKKQKKSQLSLGKETLKKALKYLKKKAAISHS